MTDAVQRLSAALADRYRIDRELGQGGMATVYLAHDVRHDRKVAVKVLLPELASAIGPERFLREITTTANLRHPHILPLYDSGEAGGFLFYVMPFVEGESLRDRLDREKQLPVDDALQIAREVADALSYAHSRGVIHRDIKPENILLEGAHAVVADFGIARAVGAAGGETLTGTGMAVGTPQYMSPEQAGGERDLDGRSDLYSLGCVLFEMLAGQPPFTGPTIESLVHQHLMAIPPPVTQLRPSVPAEVVAALQRALAKTPADRFNPVAQFAEALQSGGPGDRGTGGQRKAGSSRPAVPRPRGPALFAVALIVTVVALALWRRGASAAHTAAASAERSLAVLPLANLSGDRADDYFGIGLAEEITRALAQNGVRVIGRVSAGALQARGLDERAIARELGVGSLLTGTVQRAQGQVRINVSLLSAGDGAVRWTETYDRPLANVFAVQDEIARTVATTLLGSLGRSPSTPATRTETTDPEAHALFLQGRVLFNRRGAGPLQQAIALFERASARDPRYARAQASLAMALAVLPAYVQDSTPECVASAVAAAERAIAMDSTIAESYAALGYSHLLLRDLPRADDDFRRALSLDSTLATTWGWYGLLAARLGDYRVAHERVARARALEPASLIARLWEAQIMLPERRLAEADSVASTAIAMDSTFMLAWQGRENALLEMGQVARGVAMLERHVALLPPGRPQEAHGMLAYGYALAGRARDARALLDTMRARSGGRLPATGATAAALEVLGDHEAAVALLTEADARHDVWLAQFPRQQRYDRLRKDPRAAAVLARLGTR